MINKADSIKLSLLDLPVRFVVVAKDESEKRWAPRFEEIVAQRVRSGLNAWYCEPGTS